MAVQAKTFGFNLIFNV